LYDAAPNKIVSQNETIIGNVDVPGEIYYSGEEMTNSWVINHFFIKLIYQ
jgi:hypothetical protein